MGKCRCVYGEMMSLPLSRRITTPPFPPKTPVNVSLSSHVPLPSLLSTPSLWSCAPPLPLSVVMCPSPPSSPAITIKNCACGLALHYVACQEATASFKSKDPPPPGSLRPALLDKLYKMDELLLQSKAKIKTYSVGVSPS